MEFVTVFFGALTRLFTLLSALVLLGGGAAASYAITVVNGDFEIPGSPPFGWSAPNGTDDMIPIIGQTGLGLEIGGFGGAVNNSIDQIVAGFTIGNTYTIHFALASQWAGGSGAQASTEVDVARNLNIFLKKACEPIVQPL